MGASGASLEFRDVGMSYPGDEGDVLACRNVSFLVEPGQSVVLIGSSGCGKSTTLLMAAGLLAPSEGQVLIDGAPVGGPRRHTAFVPQDLGLFPWKTVLQNAALGLVLQGRSRASAEKQARAALDSVGLSGFEGSYPRNLSGGMRQRLAFARVLTMEADLLLMDEPLSAIDALLRENLQDMLRNFWREGSRTQVLVTHSIEEAVYLGQRIMVFSDRPGTVVAEVDNPLVGQGDLRDSLEFAEKCREVRTALASARAGDGGVSR